MASRMLREIYNFKRNFDECMTRRLFRETNIFHFLTFHIFVIKIKNKILKTTQN